MDCKGLVRLLTATIIALAAPGFATAQHNTTPSVKAGVEYLLTSAVADFRGDRAPDPVGFRNVKLGSYAAPGGEKKYLICGEYLAPNETQWVPFATVQTSKYEQWLGASSQQFCNSKSVTWQKFPGLADSLQIRLDALR